MGSSDDRYSAILRGEQHIKPRQRVHRGRRKWAVYNMAKEQIPDYLSCPSTMKICSYEDATIQDAGYNIWKGEGYFDAENLYGATVRGKWNITCKIENGKCHLAKLKIDDIVVYNDGTQ